MNPVLAAESLLELLTKIIKDNGLEIKSDKIIEKIKYGKG
jgi:hypothetical protein